MPRKETKKQFNEKDRRSFGPGGSGQSAEVVANQRATRSRRSPESATNNSEHGVVNANEKTGSTAGSPTSSQLSTTPHKQDMLGADLAERQSRATLSGRVVRARRIFDPSPSRSPPSGRSRAPSTSRPKRRQTNAEIAENLARTAFRDEDNEQPAAEDETHNSGDPDADQPGTSRPDQQLTPAQRAVEMNRIVAMRIAAENSSDDSEFAEFRLPDYEEDDREESSAQINELVEQCEVVQNGRKRKRMAHFESSSDEEPEDPTQPDELLFQTPSIPAKVVRAAPPNQTPIRGARRGRPRGSANRTITPVRAVLAMNDVFSPEISDEETNPAEESQPVQEAESIRMTRSGRSIRPRQMLSPEPEVRRQKDTAYRDHNALAYQQFEPRVFYYNGYRFQMAYPEQHNLGPRNNVCPFCNAIHFDGAHVCCRDGKVFVPPFKLLPQPLDALFTQPHDDVQSFVKEIDPAEFFTNVLHYNALFAFASICYNRQRVGKHGVPAVKIQGRSLHLASTLHPREGAEPAYANFYVFDRSKANQLRMQGRSERGQKPQKKIVEMLEKWFEENNPFARGHRRFKELINEDSETTIQYRIVDRTEYKHQLQGHKGIYAGPETLRYDEFVSVFYDASIQQTLTLPRGITIHAFFKGPRDIKPLKYFDHTVNALAYPLLFPYGESTWGPKRYELVKPAPFLVRMLNYLKEQKAIGNDTIEKDVGWQEKILEEQIKEIERQQKEAERAARSSGEDAMDEEAIEDNRPESEDSDEEDILLYRERIIQAYEADGHFESDEEYDDELVRETIENAEIEPRMEREEIRMEERGGVHYARRESVPIIEDPNIDLEFDSDEQEDEEDYTDRVRIKIADDPFNLLDSDDDTTQNPENDARAASGDVSEDDLPGTEEAAQVPIESRRFKRPMIRPESSIDAQRKRVKGKKHEFASMRDWTLYVNQKRERLRSNRILGGRKLSQVFIIDMATRIQQQRLDANRLHHTQTLKTTKKNLIKHLQKQVGDRGRIGMVTWMPATYPGSPANLRRHFENAVTLSNALGQPDLFITITCNGSWPEIQENLAPNHNWADEPFLVAEVFRKKIEVIIDTICGEKKQRNGKMKRVGGLFGGVAWYVYSVEFQQRGLPHIHMVVSLEDHIKSTEEIDSILSAELPPVPPPDHPQYEQVKCFRENVQRMMIHTPCAGNPKAYCRKEKKINPGDGLCTKKFPKSFNSATEMGNNTYVKPRRREGEMCQLKTEGRIVIADNRYVIAHNPSLLMKLGCHSNVEIVTDLKILKYIFKYIYKGFDRVLIKTALQISHENPASGMGPLSMDGHLILPQTNKLRTFDLKRRQYEARQMLAAEGIDEVDDRGRATLVYDEGRIVQDMRAMTAIEGAWEIAGYGRFGSSHIVETNFIHLPNEEPVIFEEGKEDEVSVTKLSRLDAWFALNGTNDIEAKKLTFNELPKFYKWRNGEWKKYKRNISERKIGRVKSVHPRYAEKFAVRLLTMNRTGIKSFTELRTTVDEDGVEMVHETFAGAAKALRLMDDEREWDRAIKEAAKFSEPATVRRLFSYIVLFCAPRDPLKLWNENKEKGILLEANKNWSQEQLEAHALHHIQKVLTAHAYKLKHLNLPKISTAHLPPADELEGTPNDEVDIERFKERSRQLYYMMNSGQKKALDTIITELNSDTPKLYFLNGSAGTGKTFVYEALYNELRSKGKNVTTVAHTGIAATLLQGGKTVHRTFGVPVNIDEQGACQLDFGSNAAQEINDTDILIWDESPMTEARIYQAVDRLLGDITTRKEHPFGGKTIIFGGDWKQTLPIVPEEGVSGSGIIAHLLPSFVPFGAVNGMQKLELQQNMRAKEDPEYIK
ncbi:hypothetical protein WR25_26520 isoform B [Diploscapter pachys]|uniref:ATP-dependent DNA helicase n=1 Tax=Diploscapter pachys TaxID=2018661 RepID=A0A2A2LIK9_9BILA|nr:hypothetical protein WR25_26520 isoform A [Diploscapter pachys]PAV86041.1 hypothetical protein WR25_26520 isoform B [Diploscapter pachys]